MEEYREEEYIEAESLDLRQYWRVLMKRKWTVAWFAVPLVAIVTIFSFVVTPSFTAKGTLLIEKEPNILTFEKVFQLESLMDDYYQTQFKILQSETLAENVVERMKLYEDERFTGKLNPEEQAEAADPDSTLRRRLVEKFSKKLAVKPVRQTRLVEVQFKDASPGLAAAAVNELFNAFIDMDVQLRYETTEEATEFLAKQIEVLRGEIEGKERELQQYGAEKNIVALSDTETTIIENLGALNKALTEAEIDRVRKEAYYNGIKNASPDNIPDALANPLIQRLREEYVRLSREYATKSETFKPKYPEMQRLKTELESAKSLLDKETRNIVQAAYSDYQAALKREQSLESVFNGQKQEAIQLNSNAIAYNSLKIEIENRKSLLESLIKRESETGVAARLQGLRTSNVRIVDRAKVPLKPSSPKKKLNMLLAVLLGLFGGLGLIFLFEYMDNSVKSREDVNKATGGSATLGVVPTFGPNGSGYGYRYVEGRGGIKVRIVTKSQGGRGEGRAGEDRKSEKERRQRLKGLARDGSLLDLGGDSSGVWEKESSRILSPDEKPAVQLAPAPAGSKKGSGTQMAQPEDRSMELIAHLSPRSNGAESYRTIRTSLLLSSTDRKPKAIVVTSALPEEGKSITLSNLAVTLAHAGKRVMIVDSDLRKPTQHQIFKCLNEGGLTSYLTSTRGMAEIVKGTGIPNLYLINAGPIPTNPAELLGSEKMVGLIEGLKQSLDLILLDSPPILTVSDALVLGPAIDGVVLVVWGGKTAKEVLKQAKEKLDMMKIRCLGVVINNIAVSEGDYSFMYNYYREVSEEKPSS